MSFMQKQIYFGEYFEVETTYGTEIVPADIVCNDGHTTLESLTDFLEGKPLIDDLDVIIWAETGWIARMSAPGYMDCTSYSAHKTHEEADEFLADMYGDDEE